MGNSPNNTIIAIRTNNTHGTTYHSNDKTRTGETDAMSVRMQQRKLTIDTHVAQEGYGVATAEAMAAGTDGMVDMKDWLARSNPSVRF